MSAQEVKKPAWAVCADPDCKHEWIIVYLPMEALKCAEVMMAARCPCCGGCSIYMRASPPEDHGSVDGMCAGCGKELPIEMTQFYDKETGKFYHYGCQPGAHGDG